MVFYTNAGAQSKNYMFESGKSGTNNKQTNRLFGAKKERFACAEKKKKPDGVRGYKSNLGTTGSDGKEKQTVPTALWGEAIFCGREKEKGEKRPDALKKRDHEKTVIRWGNG